MDNVVPFCPLCQVSFTRPDMQCFSLSCNHLVCQYCLLKQQYNDDLYRCYFDACYTPISNARYLQGLAEFLTNEYAEEVQLTMGTQARRLDEALRVRFNLFYERAKISCRTRNCPLALTKCGYDHSGQFYKKVNCPFSNSCPNLGTCIFLHPGEATQSSSVAISTTPRPSQMANYQTIPPAGVYPSSESPNYQLVTIPDPRVPNYAPVEGATMPVSWQCPNCRSLLTAQHLSCPQCTCVARY